jgi:anthranilate synthase component 1
VPDLPGLGAVLPLARRLDRAPDPLALYRALTDDGTRPDTLLLESLDATTRQAVKSFLITRTALRLTCRGSQVRLSPLTPGGRDALAAQREALAARGAVRADGDDLRVDYPEPPAQASEEDRLDAASPFDALRAMSLGWTLRSRPVTPAMLVAGVWSYDLLECFEQLPSGQEDPLEHPDFQFWLPQEMVIVDHERKSATAVALVYGGPHAQVGYADATAAIDRLTRAVETAPASAPPPPAEPVEAKVDTSDAAFCELVEELKQRVVAGDVFQIVPSRTFSCPCPDPLATFARLRELNPSPYMFFVRGPEHVLLDASPETSVKVSGTPRTVEIIPIAGTAPRGKTATGEIDLDLDGRLEAGLRLDEKEVAEHMMLIDLARNDVARVSEPGTRYVPKILTVDRYSHVMHLVSYVAGQLRGDLDCLHAYAASMNMGTLVGAPKLKAATILRQRERTRRGPYGGAVGYLTPDGDMDSAIVIRSAVVHDGVAYVRAGAGVVYDSVPQSEADETRRKAQAVLTALGVRA